MEGTQPRLDEKYFPFLQLLAPTLRIAARGTSVRNSVGEPYCACVCWGGGYGYSIPEGREILELREWRRSWALGMDFPMVNPAFKFSLILFLFALGIEVSLLG